MLLMRASTDNRIFPSDCLMQLLPMKSSQTKQHRHPEVNIVSAGTEEMDGSGSTSEDCPVLLPTCLYVGRSALDEVAGAHHNSLPSSLYTPHRLPKAVQHGGPLPRTSGPPGEPARYTVLDVI